MVSLSHVSDKMAAHEPSQTVLLNDVCTYAVESALTAPLDRTPALMLNCYAGTCFIQSFPNTHVKIAKHASGLGRNGLAYGLTPSPDTD